MKVRLRQAGIAALTLCATACAGTGAAAASAPRARVGSPPRLPRAAQVTGRLTGARRLSLELSLASRAPLEMQRLAEAVSTPGSPQYHHYLSVAQFASRFGATPAHVRAVSAALRAAGLRVDPVAANRLSLSVSGTAAEVQHAFATRLDAVRLADGRRAFSDRGAPTLPAAVAPDVDAIVGLNTLAPPQAGALPDSVRHAVSGPGRDVVTGGPQPCASATAAAGRLGGYTADTIQAAYNFSGLYAAGAAGAGETVAVFELEKVRAADIAAFQRCYGTHAALSIVNVGHPQNSGDDEESALDVEQIIGLAPAVHLIVYQAQDTDAAGVADYAKIIAQDRARTISVSWGACERKVTADGTDFSLVRAENKLFEEAALQGQSILSASGDTGSAGCQRDLDANGLAVQDPSSQPFATAVGGTTLYTTANGQLGLWNPAVTTDPLQESVWNDGILHVSGQPKIVEGTGGGISALWAMPAYQRHAAAALGVHNADSSGRPCRSSGDCREVPDVSLNADPNFGYVVYVSASGQHGWTVEGGTSAAAPVWAALTADTDSLASCRGASLGFENPSLYRLGATAPGDLRDITAASPVSGRADNDASNTNGGRFPVTAGYDMTTGLGVPDAAALAGGLCGLRAPVYTVALAAPHHLSTVVRAHLHLIVRGADSGRLALRFRARGLPRGVHITRRGVITGRPRRVGRYPVTVTASDHATNRATVRFRLRVLSRPARMSHVSLSGVARRRPALAFTVTRGRAAPYLRSVTVRLPRGLSPGRPGRGVHVSGGHGRVRFHARRLRDGVTIAFRRPQPRVHVTVRRPSLRASRGLAATARHRRRARVRVRLDATDRSRRTTRRSIRVRLG